jgi:hypothetical protein
MDYLTKIQKEYVFFTDMLKTQNVRKRRLQAMVSQ